LVKLDKSTIHRAILESGTIEVYDAQEIEKISSQYPFFNTAQLLLSKVYQKAGDHRFIDQLNQAAMYSIDRKVLHRYIHTSLPTKDEIEDYSIDDHPSSTEIDSEKSLSEKEEKFVPSPTNDIASNPIGISGPIAQHKLFEKTTSLEKTSGQEIDELVNSILKHEEIEPIRNEVAEKFDEKPEEEPELKKESSFDTISNSIQSETPPVEKEIISNQSKEFQITAENTSNNTEELDQEILLEAIRSSIELEVSETEAQASDEIVEITIDAPENASMLDERVEGKASSEEKVVTYADWIYRRSKQIHFTELSEKPIEDENAVPYQASDWLREESFSEKNDEKIVVTTPEILPLPEKEENEQTTLSHGVTRIDKPDKKTHQRDLVDRFIKKEPRITPGKSVDYLPGNLFKDSLEEDYEFMTETIAQLLARQGKFDKARKAYRKLIEQHPEKSVYFAAQLKNLDRLKKP
jgi:hypothetical protein